jgi:DNA-binding IclR family transcriptional regulator
MPDAAASPPTRRVLAIVEMLIRSESALNTTEVARALDIARPTATAILTELEAGGWAHRDDMLAYSVGPALARLGAVTTGRALPALMAGAALSALAHTTRCGVTMSLIGPDYLIVVDKKHGGERVIPGFPTGQKMPLEFPVGAAVMSWRPALDRAPWLATSTHSRTAADDLLRRARTSGFVIYRPNDGDTGLVDVLADLLAAIGTDILTPTVRARALRQLDTLTSRVYTEAETNGSDALPISYLTAPVFDAPGHAQFEVQLGPLRPKVAKTERDDYVAAILAAAQQISDVLQHH